jgi:hypothetical protein
MPPERDIEDSFDMLQTDRSELSRMSKEELKSNPRIYDSKVNMATAIQSMNEHNIKFKDKLKDESIVSRPSIQTSRRSNVRDPMRDMNNSLEGSLSFISYEDSWICELSEELSMNSKTYNNAI